MGPFRITTKSEKKSLQSADRNDKEKEGKISWTKEEDQLLMLCAQQTGGKRWAWVAEHFPGRSNKQCRNRYIFQLKPRSKEAFSHEEDIVIMTHFFQHGTSWSRIAKSLPNRTSNQIKNRWNSSLKRRYENNEFDELCIAHGMQVAKHPETKAKVAKAAHTNALISVSEALAAQARA